MFNNSVSGEIRRIKPQIIHTEKENRNNKISFWRDSLDCFPSVVNFVHKLEKFNAHMHKTILRVFLTKDNSPNSALPRRFEQTKVAITNTTFDVPLPIRVAINPFPMLLLRINRVILFNIIVRLGLSRHFVILVIAGLQVRHNHIYEERIMSF